MKRILAIFTTILAIAVCEALSSCSKNDSDSNPFVGTWSCDNHFYGGTAVGGGVDTFVFKNNNLYEWSCTGNWIWTPTSGKYSYNKNNGTLTLSPNGSRTTVYLVLSIEKNFFVIADIESGLEASSYTYYRQ